ncbi:SIR2 family NAD-dependent protein deacylase [Streptococcus sciuri]|uniref:Sir2 silent information regulator family NAD-dependent deacetylase n=1 Tax=Streptococcus sciuri TaxID=2973939 RepID=A0ABT2F8B7_9STRE|nr:Sir2 family NAD-dependent protein deacetylase [Streptococcus sciuri]MCS4488443.1 Sir2 silent information regulator family NAD-dependent deacetylase [Streptococcus sciuri]
MSNYSVDLKEIRQTLEEADAIVVGIGAGLSTASGIAYSGPRFMKYFADFHEKYGIEDIYSGGFYPFESLEEYWAWWSRHVYYNRYDVEIGQPYLDLLAFLEDKNYFILTTNVDHQIQRAGVDKSRLFYMQGDYGLWQCSKPCHQDTYENEKVVKQMIDQQAEMKIPSDLIPYCPRCGEPMTMNLRSDDRFVEDVGWHEAKDRYVTFLNQNISKKIVFLELGVGNDTPAIIKYPFMQMTYQNPQARFISVNVERFFLPEEIKKQSKEVVGDLAAFLGQL